MKAIKTKLTEAEKIKKKLIDIKAINTQYKTKKDKEHIYFPVKEDFIIENFNLNLELITVREDTFERIDIKEKNLKSLLKDKLTDSELEILKTAFDTVGDIAILEIDDALREKEKIIANTLLESHKNIKTVLRKDDKHDGEFRTQKMMWLAGVETKETIHKENNVTLSVNVETVYFSPRLSSERKRIAAQVKKDEEILVMFSGCAPYPCVLAKNTQAKNITAIELNPQGHEYALKNIALNKITNVTLINGDVKKETTQIYKNIIGVKSALAELEIKLKAKPRVFEFFLNKEDLNENREELERAIIKLKKETKVFLHMPVPLNGTALLGDKDPQEAITQFKILGDICQKHKVHAIIHMTWEVPKIPETELIENIKKLKKYYNEFYFENLQNYYAKDIVRINKKAGIKKVCIDIAHLYKTYKDNNKIINHIKEMQKNHETYYHLSDSDGLLEGQQFGEGHINIQEILPYVTEGIVEIKNKDEKKPDEMINTYNEIIKEKRFFDRIIMPLPKNAEDFLDAALEVSKKGTKIHFYNFLHEDEFDEAERKVKDACRKYGFEYKKIELIKAGQQSPRTYRICLDFEVQ